jgi:hypothetical protein
MLAGDDEDEIKTGCFEVAKVICDDLLIGSGELKLMDDPLPVLVDSLQPIAVESVRLESN